MSYANLAEMFFTRARELAARPRYRYRVADGWREVTWQTMAERVRAIAAGLLDLGVAPGDRVALLSNTRPEWMEIDFAILACGALTVPIYQSNLPAECGYIIANSESSVVFVENPKQRAKIEEVTRHGFELDGVRQTIGVRAVITIEGDPGAGESLAALVKRGRDALGHLLGELDARIADLRRDQLATIVYTSGTTGPPKGVLQTHGNHLATVESLLKLGIAREGDVDFFFLPLAHSFARLIEYYGIAAGTITAFARSIDNLAEDLAGSRPHLVPAVPRIYEKLYGRIQGARESGGALRRALFDWAVGVGRARSRHEQEGRPVPTLLQWQHGLAHRLVFSRIHQLLGGNIRYMTSGGAPLSREIAEFFHAVGIPILEGYGLTETTPSLTVNQPERFKLGTVGLPLDCCELRIAPDGEILARGANIALGYHRRPEATAESWDREGWFHTGDIGEFDADGFLRITDRKKDLIKTSGGKYVAPQKIENLLKLQPHVSQAVVIGDNRKYCTALITLDQEEVGRWASAQGLRFASPEEMAAHPRVREVIEAEVAAANKELASYESIKYFRILPRDLSTETGELTPSLKVKRKVMAERYRQQIEEMYAG
ncbi:MAG: long-chain fatty acid--CoA ligase [Deltaproteobacteria bacterium]|nr:MAG: long-chain fatty acid--CoA ligase [Deltaproteobacteria bacterium]